MFQEAITKDLRFIDWELIHPIVEYQMNTRIPTPDERKTLQELKELPECVIKPSDKGGNVVLWQEKNYLEEVYRQLNDPSCYEKWPKKSVP